MGLSSSKQRRRYDYFNLSDQEIKPDHKFQRLPEKCSKSNSDYYTLNNLYCSNVGEFEKLWDSAITEGRNWLVVKVPICNPEDMTSLLCERAFKIAFKHMNEAEIIYSYNEARGIFQISLERDNKKVWT